MKVRNYQSLIPTNYYLSKSFARRENGNRNEKERLEENS